MGCEVLAEAGASDEVRKFQILVALMLSSQTKDEVTSAAVRRLQAWDRGLSVESIAAASPEEIGPLVKPVGFWRSKSKYLVRASRLMLAKYNGRIPPTVEGLMDLPGVGPKMAMLAMTVAHRRVVGIGVDTHVHRIANRLGGHCPLWHRCKPLARQRHHTHTKALYLGWVKTQAKRPEDTRLALEAWLPREHWCALNLLLVGFGQQVCHARLPLCQGCLNRDVCPASTAKARKRSKKAL